MEDPTEPLTETQEHVWRALLRLTTRLPARLTRQLEDDCGLSLACVDVLVGLAGRPDGRTRVGVLARALGWERSRLSHQVARMERDGLVRRDTCDDDGRGSCVVITGAGRHAVGSAAPVHAALARALVVDALTDDQLVRFGTLVDTVLRRIADSATPAPDADRRDPPPGGGDH